MEAVAMRLRNPRHLLAWSASAIVLTSFLGAGPFSNKDKEKAAAKKAAMTLKVDETVGDIAKIPPLSDIRLEGVGLVIGLDGTGSEAQPSGWRTKLLERMRKDGVHDAEKYLSDPSTSLVLLRGKVPAGITTEDVSDVDVELDPASTTTSLAGGLLFKADLYRVEYGSKGELLPDGKVMATVYGPVMTGSEAKPDDLRRGRILGGARVKKDEPYALIINEKRKSVRTAALLQSVINSRFSRIKGIDQEGMAKAHSDQFLILGIPRMYHHNQYRYFQVVENLSVVDTPELRQARLAKWGQELLDPRTAGAAAIRLEGIGRNASPTLKAALSAPHPQVRFFAAEALAYLGDDAGTGELAKAARDRPEFRLQALAALAAMDQPSASMRLREMMAEPDPTVRYGAFNALRIVDKTDPFLGRVRIRHDDPEPEEPPDGMAMKIATTRKSRRRADPFELYVVDCDGPPLVHVANTRRCEVVIFGKGARLLTPVVLGVGPIQVNATDGDPHVIVSRIGSEAIDGPDQKVPTRTLALAEMIIEAANLGTTYPEVLTLLRAAERQHNLASVAGAPPLVVDALPSANPAYDQAQIAGKDATAKTDPALERASTNSAKSGAKTGILDRMFRRGSK
jgi:HEAT repeat protein